MDNQAAVAEETNGNSSCSEQTANLDDSEATVYQGVKTHAKRLQLEDPEKVPANLADYLNDTTTSVSEQSPVKEATPAIPTSVITSAAAETSNGEQTNGQANQESVTESELSLPLAPSNQVPENLLDTEAAEKVTVADLVEKAQDEEENKELVENKDETGDKVESTAINKANIINNVDNTNNANQEKTVEKKEEVDVSKPKPINTPNQEVKTKKSAKELAEDWEDEGDVTEPEGGSTEEKGEDIVIKTEKKKEEGMAEVDTTPVRKSGRAPKPTEKLLEGKQQEKMKTVDDEEESVDAIAAELEKSDTEVKKSGGKKTKSPKKQGPRQGENQEDWVSLIFGENGEKVTEKGKKVGEKEKEDGDKEDADQLPDAEEFLMEQTQFFSKGGSAVKKGGRPRKKDLDEKLDGVAKLGSNMYFYTGPGATTSDSPINSDDDEETVKAKEKNESARKSGRANKGKNSRLERSDEVVEMPQAKAKEASLNPSWLKQHDGKKETPTKKVVGTPVKVAPSTTPSSGPKKGRPSNKEKQRKEEEEESMDTETDIQEGSVPEVPVLGDKSSIPLPDVPEEELKKLAGQTVKKGEHEYVIVVQGVTDTGLCGKYWGDLDNLPSRRRSKQPEQLQIGAGRDTPTSRRGSVGSVGSGELATPAKAKATPTTTPKVTPKQEPSVTPKAVPKSNKKQVTKPEKKERVAENADSSQSEGEEPELKARGRKRKAEVESPVSDKKAKKGKAKKESDEPETTFSDYDSAGGSEGQKAKNKGKESPTKESSVSSKQQNAVSAALAAGVPAGQQRSVSCVADTSTQREVVVECFAPYDDHRWVNIGKERDQMAPDAVQYARALRPPYHLLSFLRIKGHSTKGMSCTDKNTMVFVVLEGEITVILHTTQFNAKKGDSFYIPPKNYYNLINQKAREAELSLIQFQYDGPLPTVQPTTQA